MPVEPRFIDIKTPGSTTFVGRCIYCGTQEGKLTEEHIVPRSLGGRNKLEKASCEPCREITHAFETKLINREFRDFREASGFPRSRKHKAPLREHIPLVFTHPREGFRQVPVKREKYPRFLRLPLYPQPGILVGRPIEAPVVIPIALLAPSPDMRGHTVAYINYNYHHHSFCRMLSKIALGMAIRAWGWEKVNEYEILANRLIHDGELIGGWLIGRDLCPHPPNPKIFDEYYVAISKIGETEFLLVRMRLFAYMGAPYYLSVIGRRPLSEPPKQPPGTTT